MTSKGVNARQPIDFLHFLVKIETPLTQTLAPDSRNAREKRRLTVKTLHPGTAGTERIFRGDIPTPRKTPDGTYK